MNLQRYCPKALYPALQKFRSIFNIMILGYYKITAKLDEESILLYSVSRQSLCGNLLFIYEKIKDSGLNVSIVLENDGTAKKQLLKKFAQSKYILIDDYTPIIYPLKLRQCTRLIQVWHSAGAFKRMGFSRMGHKGSTVSTSLTHGNYTDVIVSSEGVVENFVEAFGVSASRIHPIGIPRTDVFFDKEYINKVQEGFKIKYPVLKHKKLILFAPTFRGETRDAAYYPKSYLNIETLVSRYKDEYVFGIKLHPFIKDRLEIPDIYKDNVIDFSDEREINDLLFITDILITDYSSVIFEYAFLEKPIVFYAPDLNQYIKDRDFFYNYNEYTYGAFAGSFDELIKAIDNIYIDQEKLKRFRIKFLSACDGNSTQRFVDSIFKE